MNLFWAFVFICGAIIILVTLSGFLHSKINSLYSQLYEERERRMKKNMELEKRLYVIEKRLKIEKREEKDYDDEEEF